MRIELINDIKGSDPEPHRAGRDRLICLLNKVLGLVVPHRAGSYHLFWLVLHASRHFILREHLRQVLRVASHHVAHGFVAAAEDAKLALQRDLPKNFIGDGL